MGKPSRKRSAVVATSATSAEQAAAPSEPHLTSIPYDGATVDGAAFNAALARICHVADKRAAMPILGHVALRTVGDTLQLVCTDLDACLVVEVPLLHTERLGICVPAHALAALVRTLPEGPVGLHQVDYNALRVTSGTASARLVCVPDREFPAVPTHTGDWRAVSAAALRRVAAAVRFSQCKDETRFHLAGALLQSDAETVTMVSTDGHRLTVAREAWDGPDLPASGILLARMATAHIERLCSRVDTVEIGVTGRHVFLRRPGLTLALRSVDAQFPPYVQVIPKGFRALITVDRKALLTSVKRNATGGRKVPIATRFDVGEGNLVVSSRDPDAGEVSETIPTDYRGDGFRWGCNPRYVAEVLAELTSETVTIAFGAELDPILIRETDDAAMRPLLSSHFLGVVMPMRL